jgi:hypothetical protein
MAGKNTAVFGIYPSAEHAERAVDTLIAAGFASPDISVLLSDTRSTREWLPDGACDPDWGASHRANLVLERGFN